MRTLMMMTVAVYAVGSYSFGGATMAQGRTAGAAKNVVLVHGAFADESSWSKVVPLLKANRMIDREQERSMAKQIKAQATVLASSHVAMLSHPADVAKVIEEAAANGHRR